MYMKRDYSAEFRAVTVLLTENMQSVAKMMKNVHREGIGLRNGQTKEIECVFL